MRWKVRNWFSKRLEEKHTKPRPRSNTLPAHPYTFINHGACMRGRHAQSRPEAKTNMNLKAGAYSAGGPSKPSPAPSLNFSTDEGSDSREPLIFKKLVVTRPGSLQPSCNGSKSKGEAIQLVSKPLASIQYTGD